MRALAAAAILALAPPAAAADRDLLRVIVIDVEGGAATLYVTPGGRSLLVDTGWPANMGGPPGQPGPSSADRIIATARAEGLRRIDYLMVSHYHVDHVGGAAELLGKFPIGTVIDHGPNREQPEPGKAPGPAAPATLYPHYLAAIGARPHRVMRPGDRFDIDGLVVTALDSDGAIPARPQAGAGAPGTDCAKATPNAQVGGEENPRSLGFVASWGKARLLSLADTTWEMEARLVCPRDLIGPVDLMLADNHGSANSNNPVLMATVRPTVAAIANGATKGADPSTYATLTAQGSAVWQVHFATRSPSANAPEPQIANSQGQDARHPLRIGVSRGGSVTLTNPRNGFSITYPKRAR